MINIDWEIGIVLLLGQGQGSARFAPKRFTFPGKVFPEPTHLGELNK